jgi:hypothetical protein
VGIGNAISASGSAAALFSMADMREHRIASARLVEVPSLSCTCLYCRVVGLRYNYASTQNVQELLGDTYGQSHVLP